MGGGILRMETDFTKFPRDFLEMTEMALLDAKNEAKKIRLEGNRRLEEIQHEYQSKIYHKLIDMDKEHQRSMEFKRNSEISNIIITQRLKILEKQNELIDQFLVEIKQHINNLITNNFKDYIKEIQTEIVRVAKLGKEDCEVYLNTRDFNVLQERKWISQDLQFQMSFRDSKEDSLGGFIMKWRGGSKRVDLRIETKLDVLHSEIKVEFSNHFPSMGHFSGDKTE